MSRDLLSRLATLLLLAAAAWGLFHWASLADRDAAPGDRGGPLAPGFDPAAVTRLRLQLHAGTLLELEREAGGLWWITRPTRELARQERIATILENVQQAWVEPVELHGGPLRAADVGLEPPRHLIGWDWHGHSRAVLLGDPEPLGGALYLRRSGDERILLGPRNLVTLLATNAEAFVDHSLLRGARGAVRRLVVQHDDTLELDAERRGDRWVLNHPPGVLPDDNRLDQLVATLQFLVAEITLDVNPLPSRLATWGLPGPEQAQAGELAGATRLAVTTTSGETSTLYLAAGWQMQSGALAVLRDDFAKVLGVDSAALRMLRNPADFYRARRLLPPVRERADSLRLLRDGEVLVGLRREATGWRFTDPPRLAGEEVETARVAGRSSLTDLLGRLDALEAVGFDDPPAGTPVARIVVGWTRAGESRQDTVDLHAPLADGRVPAVTSERPDEGLLLPPGALELFDPLVADMLRWLAPLRALPAERWAAIEIGLPGRAEPLVAERDPSGGAWIGDDQWSRRRALGHDLLGGLRGFRWVAAAPEHPFTHRVTLRDEQGEPLASLQLRAPEAGELHEADGFPVARMALASRPGVELLVHRDWLARLEQLDGPLAR